MLQQLFGSQGRAEILKNLFTAEHKSIHVRELARLSGLSAPVLLRELRQWAGLGLLNEQADGNRVKFSANTENPLYPLLSELVLKTEGPAGVLKTVFADCSAGIIFIFGSTANGTAQPDSDIDLFVLGDCGLRDVARRIHAAAEKITQEINPCVISKEDFLARMQNQDHFLCEVSRSPKIFLKGSADEFERLAK